MPPVKSDALVEVLAADPEDAPPPVFIQEDETGGIPIIAYAASGTVAEDFDEAIQVDDIIEMEEGDPYAVCLLTCLRADVDSKLMIMEELTLLDVPGTVFPCLDQSVLSTEVNDCWYATPDTPSPWNPPWLGSATGLGVCVAIIDTGIDFLHADFRNADDTTRCAFIRDITTNTEWNAAQINGGSCTQQDTDGHGTHLAGIAAGNGRATGNGKLARRYVGMAPEATLLVCKMRALTGAGNSEADMLAGINWARSKANGLNMPLVCIVAGAVRLRDAHKGTQALATTLSGIRTVGGTGKSCIIVAAAGNEGLKARHAYSHISGPVGDITPFQFNVPAHDLTTQGRLIIHAYWAMGPTLLDELDYRITNPLGEATDWFSRLAGASWSWGPGFGFSFDGSCSLESGQGLPKFAVLQIRFLESSEPMTAGTWTIEFRRRPQENEIPPGINRSKEVDLYMSQWKFATNWDDESVAPTFLTKVVNARTVVSPANGRRVIAAGAYNHRAGWTDVDNIARTYADAPAVGKVANFSARGSNWDGHPKPDFVAPGFGVISAMSANMTPPANDFIVDDGKHRVERGTSMAAAHVAGLAALVLQRIPTCDFERMRSILGTAATVDMDTGVPHSGHYGYGKIHSACGPTVASSFYFGVAHVSSTIFRITAINTPGFLEASITATDAGEGTVLAYSDELGGYIQVAITNKQFNAVPQLISFDIHHEEPGDGEYFYQLAGILNLSSQPFPVMMIRFGMSGGNAGIPTIDQPPPGDLVSETGQRRHRRDI